MTFRAILFDLDGTLIDSAADICAAVNAARAALGRVPLAVATIRGHIGDGVDHLVGKCFPAEEAPRAAAVYRAHYAGHLLDETRPYPGVAALLAELREAGLGLAVVTNKPRAYTDAILAGLSLGPFFGSVVAGDGPHGRKPLPGPFEAALGALGARPGEALVVGDGRNDVLGARAAGIRVCGALYGIGSADEMRALGPDFLIEQIGGLGEILGRSGK